MKKVSFLLSPSTTRLPLHHHQQHRDEHTRNERVARLFSSVYLFPDSFLCVIFFRGRYAPIRVHLRCFAFLSHRQPQNNQAPSADEWTANSKQFECFLSSEFFSWISCDDDDEDTSEWPQERKRWRRGGTHWIIRENRKQRRRVERRKNRRTFITF